MRLPVILDDGRPAVIFIPKRVSYRSSGRKWFIRIGMESATGVGILTWLPVFTPWFMQDLPPATLQPVIEFIPDFGVAI